MGLGKIGETGKCEWVTGSRLYLTESLGRKKINKKTITNTFNDNLVYFLSMEGV